MNDLSELTIKRFSSVSISERIEINATGGISSSNRFLMASLISKVLLPIITPVLVALDSIQFKVACTIGINNCKILFLLSTFWES